MSKKSKFWTARLEYKLTLLYPNKKNAEIAIKLGATEGMIAAKAFKLRLRKTKEFMRKQALKTTFKKGHVPFNKGKKQIEFMSKAAIQKTATTRFKKGHLPYNSIGIKNGDIRIRTDHKKRGGKSYQYIRLSLGKWHPLHQFLWEKEYGKLPIGHCLWFKDGNTMNCTLSNLELITRAENMRRNSCSIRLTDNYIAFALSRKKGSVGAFNKYLLIKIKENKELINAKRAQLLLQRTIKSKNNVKQ